MSSLQQLSCFFALSFLSLSSIDSAQSPCASGPQLTVIGEGTMGTAGVPQVRTVGLPVLGGPMSLQVRDALPNTIGILFYSATNTPTFLPQLGGSFELGLPVFAKAFGLGSDGQSPLLLAQGAVDSSFCGLAVFFQAGVLDAGAQGELSLSNALRIQFGTPRGSIFPGVKLDVGDQPVSLAVTDVNMDGELDLFTANSGSNDISLLLGSGSATFMTEVRRPVGNNPVAIAATDLNNDSFPDLVVVNQDDDDLSILLGNGNGGLTSLPRLPVSESPTHLCIADLNHDNLVDIAITHPFNSQFSILLGAGDGTFSISSVPSPQFLGPFVAGDFDQDGNQDLAAAGGDSAFYLFGGQGDGSFTLEAQIPVEGFGSESITASDIDNDGDLDVAISHELTDYITVLIGMGNGIFEAPTMYFAGDRVVNIASSDLNHDGFPELIVANEKTDMVGVLKGVGDGSFESIKYFLAGESPKFIVSTDFDANGDLDLAVLNQGYGEVSILLGSGDTNLEVAGKYPAPVPVSIITGDLNSDGFDDLVTASRQPGDVSVLLGLGGGLFGPAQNFPVGDEPEGVVIADFDLNGSPDVASANSVSNDVSVLLGDGTGLLGPSAPYPVGMAPLELLAADLSGNGVQDLATANVNSHDISVLIGIGDGTFATAQHYSVNNGQGARPFDVAAADLNNDGALDLASANFFTSDAAVFLGDGTGSFSAPAHFPVPKSPGSLAIADLNADGHQDIALTNGDAGVAYVLIGVGNASYAAPTSFGVGTTASHLELADLNGDASIDLIVVNSGPGFDGTATAGDVTIALGNGDGTFGLPQTFSSGRRSRSLAVSDLDNDGTLDVVVANRVSSDVSVLLNRLLKSN